MANLKLAKLPDRTPVKLSITITPDLQNALREYAALYAQAYETKAHRRADSRDAGGFSRKRPQLCSGAGGGTAGTHMIDLQTKPALRPLTTGVALLTPVIRFSGFRCCHVIRSREPETTP